MFQPLVREALSELNNDKQCNKTPFRSALQKINLHHQDSINAGQLPYIFNLITKTLFLFTSKESATDIPLDFSIQPYFLSWIGWRKCFFFFGAIIINVICTIHQSPTLYYVLNGKELDRDWAITKLLRIVLINLSIKTRKSVKLKVHG